MGANEPHTPTYAEMQSHKLGTLMSMATQNNALCEWVDGWLNEAEAQWSGLELFIPPQLKARLELIIKNQRIVNAFVESIEYESDPSRPF